MCQQLRKSVLQTIGLYPAGNRKIVAVDIYPAQVNGVIAAIHFQAFARNRIGRTIVLGKRDHLVNCAGMFIARCIGYLQ